MSKTAFLAILKVVCFVSTHSVLELYSSGMCKEHDLFRYQNRAFSILLKTMLSSISEKVKTCNVSIKNDLSQHRKNLLIFVMNIYLFQPELLNFD